MYKKIIVFILFFLLAISANIALAQVRSTDVVLQTNPLYPGPRESVTFYVDSVVADLDKAVISWSASNGEETAGIGRKTFSTETGDLGSALVVNVDITTANGQSIRKTVSVSPAGVDLLWQAVDAYTPPFYRGRSYAGKEGWFKVVAMPGIVSKNSKVSPNNLSYTWKKNGDKFLSDSGWGKNSFTYKLSFLDEEAKIDVEASDIYGTSTSRGSIVLRTKEPKLVFYEKSPLTGLKMEKVVEDGYQLGRDGVIIVAVPYFLSPKNLNSADYRYSWFLGDNQIATPAPKNELFIKPESGKKGTASIELNIKNTDSLFQSVEKTINVAL